MQSNRWVRRLTVESLERRNLMAVLTVSNTNDSGSGSLRAAIEAANADSALDTIQFALAGSGVRTINLSSALPGLFTPMQIDGWSQSGYSGKPLIQLQAAAVIDYGLSILQVTALYVDWSSLALATAIWPSGVATTIKSKATTSAPMARARPWQGQHDL